MENLEVKTSLIDTNNINEVNNINNAIDVDNTNNQYPEGFNAEIYNLETQSLREDKVRELLNQNKQTIADLEKQKTDLRKIISKGKEPVDIKEYETYKPDSKYEKYYNEDEQTQTTFKLFNELSKNAGLNLEQHKMITDFMNGVLEKVGIFDTRTEEQKRLQAEDWKRQEYKKIGENAEFIIGKNKDFINNYSFFNEEQKKSLMNFMGQSALNVSVVNTLREILGHEELGSIPTAQATGGLADDRTLWREFVNAEPYRQEQIIQERLKAGRSADWKL